MSAKPVRITFPRCCRLRPFQQLARFDWLWLARVTFTSAQSAAAPLLVAAFEMTLRAADVHEDVITGLCVHKIKNATAMDSTVKELRVTVRDPFGIDTVKHGLFLLSFVFVMGWFWETLLMSVQPGWRLVDV